MSSTGRAFSNSSLAHKPPQHKTPHCEVRKPVFPYGIQGCFGGLEKQRTGTFVASPEPELRTSGDISQWTDTGRNSIASGRRKSLNFSLVMSTSSPQSPVSSQDESTKTLQERVHAFPFTRKDFNVISAEACLCPLDQFSLECQNVQIMELNSTFKAPCIFS